MIYFIAFIITAVFFMWAVEVAINLLEKLSEALDCIDDWLKELEERVTKLEV